MLRHYPDTAHGRTLVVDAALVRDTARRRRLDQSVVAVRAGERLSETQALQAILLPSANNIAVALGRRQAGSVAAFVAEMNATAAGLGMTHTHYTDPSGFANDTVSTASDQVVLLSAAMRIPAFVRVASLREATIPVAGRILNTNRLIGHDGFLLGKTGSDTAAGGCLAFARRTRSGSGPGDHDRRRAGPAWRTISGCRPERGQAPGRLRAPDRELSDHQTALTALGSAWGAAQRSGRAFAALGCPVAQSSALRW